MKSKKIILILTVALIVSSLGLTFGENLFMSINVAISDAFRIEYNGKDVTPIENQMFVYEDRSYIPLRETLELMGKEVSWNQESNTVVISDGTDTFTSASVVNYYESSSLKDEALFTALKNRECAISIATVNPDGTPNAAVVIPGVADENTLMFGLADNQTKINLMTDHEAVITAYIYSPNEESKADRNIGAKIKVMYISDEMKIKELIEKTGAAEGTIFVEIVEVLPLG